MSSDIEGQILENRMASHHKLNNALKQPFIIEMVLWFIFLSGMFLKYFYFQFSSDINSKPYFSANNASMILSILASLILTAALVLLVFNKKRLTALFAADIVLTAVLLADTLYFRYYDNAITFSVLYQIGLVSSITDSVKSLFRPEDILFIMDMPLFIAGLVLLKKQSGSDAVGVPHGVTAIRFIKRGLIALILLGLSFGLYRVAYSRSSPGVFMYDNNYVINDMGIFYFHYYDIKQNIRERYFTDHTLSAEEKNELLTYYQSKTTDGNKYHGAAKGKNLIIIQMEAIQQFVINAEFNGREITPNLNKFIEDSIYLDQFYYQVGPGNTSDAEFLTNTSLYPLQDGAVYFKNPTNTYNSLPKLLKKQGYSTYVSHAYKPSFWNRTEMYKALGFDRFINKKDFVQDDLIGWGLSDKSFFRQSLEKIDTSKPFYGFFITLSSHHPYNYFEDYQGFDVGSYEDTMTGNYVKAANYVDQAIGQLFDDLKQKGLYDNSIIIIYGDHHALLKDQTEMLTNLVNFEFSEYNWTKLSKTPCFIRFPGMDETGVNSTICGEIDLLPTVANLMGLEAPYALGKDILNTNKGYAVLRDSSIITDDFIYVSDEDQVYDKNGQLADRAKYEETIRKYRYELEISDMILKNNAFKSLK